MEVSVVEPTIVIVETEDPEVVNVSVLGTTFNESLQAALDEKMDLTGGSITGQVQVTPTADTGTNQITGGAINLNMTSNNGAGIVVYSNNGTTANSHLHILTTANALFDQHAQYIDYQGINHAVTINHQGTGSASSALNIASTNPSMSAMQLAGVETGTGTLKITHTATSGDSSAAGLSIDLAGSGTAAQGIFIDSSGTTTGNLLTIRNNATARLVLSAAGNLALGTNGINTTFTKTGNTAGDEFFIGTNGAVRMQRSAGSSECFRVQVNGDSQGRMLLNSSGVLSFGPGNATQDTNLYRSTTDTLRTDDSFSIGGRLIVPTSVTPASASATGTAGTIAWDSSFIYICVATNTWKRVAIATW